MVLWYLGSHGVEKVLVQKVSDEVWRISDKGIISDGSDLFRTKNAAMKRFIKNLGGRSTKVPYLTVIDGKAA